MGEGWRGGVKDGGLAVIKANTVIKRESKGGVGCRQQIGGKLRWARLPVPIRYKQTHSSDFLSAFL